MKSRPSRASNNREPIAGRLSSKSETSSASAPVVRNQVQLSQAQVSAQAIRKRRSSINVYDQPSSLNSRLRQLETDMLRLDEDRTKLFDDTHSALARYELRLNEIQAILKSRQDNADKHVEDMKLLIQAKEEFEKQAKLLHEKHDRVHEKFLHRETTISREIKLLKSKFELLEKSRQFRSILEKSRLASSSMDHEPDHDLESADQSHRGQAGGSPMTDDQSRHSQASSRSPKTSSGGAANLSLGAGKRINMPTLGLKSIMAFFRGLAGRRGVTRSNKVASSPSSEQTNESEETRDQQQDDSKRQAPRLRQRGRVARVLATFFRASSWRK